jgi:hypothetical protein
MAKPILALDFDGVLHSYRSGWKGAHRIDDPPTDGAGLFLLRALRHFRVAITSSRSKSLRGRWAMRRFIRQLLRDAYFAYSSEGDETWQSVIGRPADWRPWTGGDVMDAADELAAKIMWPWFKPAAFLTLDDRAITFEGAWPDVDRLRGFKPWTALRV